MLDVMIRGMMVGFFFPLGSLAWLLRSDVWSEKWQVFVGSGVALSLLVGVVMSITNIYYWGRRISGIAFASPWVQYERFFLLAEFNLLHLISSCNANQPLYTHLIGILAGLYVFRQSSSSPRYMLCCLWAWKISSIWHVKVKHLTHAIRQQGKNNQPKIILSSTKRNHYLMYC